MSHSEDFNTDEHAPVDSEYLKELAENRTGEDVFGPTEGPFEAPAKEFVPGPYYADATEVMADVAESGSNDQEQDLAVDRRNFMRLFGASAVFASTSCVRRPVEKALPYVNQPVDQVPGNATYYATTCNDCASKCGVLVKTREGRPVKIEGAKSHPLSQGATCALGQSTLQSLFHPERAKSPGVRFGSELKQTKWDDALAYLGAELKGKKVAILTNGSTGHRDEFYREFLANIGSDPERLYTYESNTLWSAQASAYKQAFGVEGIPRTEINKSEIIVGLGADFLEVGIAGVYSMKSFAQSQNFVRGNKGTFVQFETSLSATGGRADERHVIPAGMEVIAALLLSQSLLSNPKCKGSQSEKNIIKKALDSQKPVLSGAYEKIGITKAIFDELAERMLSSRTTVIAGGSQNFDTNASTLQLAAIMANVLVGAYGETLFLDHGWMLSPVESGGIKRFLADAPELDAVFIIDCDPAFNVPASWGVKDALKGIANVITINSRRTVTDGLANVVLNGHHFLEAWGDEEQVAGFWSLRQPTVRPAFNSRQAEDVMLWIAAYVGKPMGYKDYYSYLKSKWQGFHKQLGATADFDLFFKDAQKQGFRAKLSKRSMPGLKDFTGELKLDSPQQSAITLLATLDTRLRDGRGADRPVLQEVGDSMTTITWDSFLLMHPKKAHELGVRRNDVVKVTSEAGTFEVAVYPMPGMHPNTVVVPRGNGLPDGVSKVTDGVGVDPLIAFARQEDSLSGEPVTAGVSVTIEKTGRVHRLAAMQKHNDIANRSDVVKKVALEKARADIRKTVNLDDVPDLYPKLEEGEYRWGLSVDLTACVGCSACMVACSIENNVPQIGRKQVLMGREMHWIRLDRYFSGPVDNPDVTFQPVMCQQCNHAPCEAVCPVYATVHDPEGINTQTYNRCVGTRYCANACPYKVRRFNWFTHKWNIMGEKERDRNPRALNPDVTVRTRGIMEKCTFCIQRVRAGKYNAKGDGRRVYDNEVQTACQQVCPTNAIAFGDLKNERSQISAARKDSRAFLMLNGDHEHKHYGIKTMPNVSYLAKVVNKEETSSDHHG